MENVVILGGQRESARICRRLMAWLREIGLEFVDIIVRSERASADEFDRVMEHASNGIVERAIQSVQGMIRTISSAIEETWEVQIDVTHSVWLSTLLDPLLVLGASPLLLLEFVVVVVDACVQRCVCPHLRAVAVMSPRTNFFVAGHLGLNSLRPRHHPSSS